MPVVSTEMQRSFIPPPRSGRLRVMDSHEFVEMYRGDKDLRVGKLLTRQFGCEFVQLGTNIASPADSRIFRSPEFPISEVGSLPDNYHLLLMKSKLVFHRKGNISLGGFFRWTPRLIDQVLRWKPDLIFENPYLTLTPRSYQTSLAARLLHIPMVYLDAGDVLPTLTLKHRLVLPVERRVVNRAARIITYNEAGKQRFVGKYGYPADRISVIPKPIDTQRFQPQIDTNGFRRKYGLVGKFVVAYFGRLSTNKGARHLLEAAEIMRYRGTDHDLAFLFVGGNLEADQAADFRERMTTLNLATVRTTGMVPNRDMPEAYAGVDVAVFPDVTNLPGFSTVLAESMATGLPIIIGIRGWESAVPLIEGETGLIIDPANPSQIADCIGRLRNEGDLRGRLARQVRRYAEENMAYERVVQKYHELFLQLTGVHTRKGNDRPVSTTSSR